MSRLITPGLAVVVLAWSATGIQARPAILELEAGLLPTAPVKRSISDPATGARVTVFRGSLVVPFVIRGEHTFFASRLSGSRVGISPRPIDPAEPVWVESLYDIDLQLVLQRTVSHRTQLTLVLAPGLASDLRNTGWEHSTIQAAALLTRTWAPGRSWGLGLSASNAFGERRVLPLVALEWEGARARAGVLAPAHAEAFWTPGHRIEVGVRADLDGNVYTLGRDGTLKGGLARYSVIDVGPEIRLALTHNLRLSLVGGASLRRRLEVEDAGRARVEDATLRRGTHLRAGLSWLAPSGGRGG